MPQSKKEAVAASEGYHPPIKQTIFSEKDFSQLSQNEHYRYPPNSKKVGHIVLSNKNGNQVAHQFDLQSGGADAPIVRPLINIKATEPYRGMLRYEAQTPDGYTKMYAKRFAFANIGDGFEEEALTIACFSPTYHDKAPFWGSAHPTPIFKNDLSSEEKSTLDEYIQDITPIVKAGASLDVEPESVYERDQIKRRVPNQNQVMGESARDAYEHFFDDLLEYLHPNMQKHLQRAFNAEVRGSIFKNNYRPEWLHAYGWSLSPMSTNPQISENLGAGPKWANTQMMIIERTIKWFAQNAPDVMLSIKPKFDMLLDSELIKHIDFSGRVALKNRFVELTQSIDVLKAFPVFPKASDLAQCANITYNYLNHITPTSISYIDGQAPLHLNDSLLVQEGHKSPIPPKDEQDSVQSVKPPKASRKRAHDMDDIADEAPDKKRQCIHHEPDAHHHQSRRGGIYSVQPDETAATNSPAAFFNHIHLNKADALQTAAITREGMQRLLTHLGQPNMALGSIKEGHAQLSLEALNKQKMMPVLIHGAKQSSGHWLMLTQQNKQQFSLFDPEGRFSAVNYVKPIKAALPRCALLNVIPNRGGLNRGLSGYWAASVGIRASYLIQQGYLAHPMQTLDTRLKKLGTMVSSWMADELESVKTSFIRKWTQQFNTTDISYTVQAPKDATDLRLLSRDNSFENHFECGLSPVAEGLYESDDGYLADDEQAPEPGLQQPRPNAFSRPHFFKFSPVVEKEKEVNMVACAQQK